MLVVSLSFPACTEPDDVYVYYNQPELVSSPNYGTGVPYHEDLSCVWHISTEPGKKLLIHVEGGTFDVRTYR